MISVILAAAIAGSGPGSAPAQDQWLACARSVAEAQLGQGIPDSWPKVDSLPSQEPSVTAILSSTPNEPAYDPVHRTLHGYSGANLIYIESFGGIGDFHVFYGPISLAGRCAASPRHAP
jgi:hypothetical protein